MLRCGLYANTANQKHKDGPAHWRFAMLNIMEIALAVIICLAI
jgi:hypothetical protein